MLTYVVISESTSVHSVELFYETSQDLFKRFKKWTPSESVTSWGMPRVGLREVIFVSLLLALSTDLAVANKGLQTNETEPKDLPQPQKDLNNRKEKSSTIIPRLPENFSVRISRRRRLKLIMRL